MPTSYVTRKEAAELSGASQAVINKAIEQKVVPTRRMKAGALLDARDVPALTLFTELAPFALPVKQKKRLQLWVREVTTAGAAAELILSPALVVRLTEEIQEAMRRAKRYVDLRERYVETNPRIRGGEPVIRGTRVPIRGLAKQIEAGETPEILREEYPDTPEEVFEFVTLWAKANPRRGRPAPPWEHGSSTKEPEDRAALVESRKRRATQSTV